MKIGLLADTQGSFDVEALLTYVGKEFAGADEIWHAGDWGSEDVLEGLRRLGRLVVVNGNAPSDSRYPTTIEGTIGRWRVGMVHNLDKQRARWAANFDVVIHGHTHRFRDELVGRTRFINPGTAICLPLRSSSSMGFVATSIGPYPSPMLEPLAITTYLSATYG